MPSVPPCSFPAQGRTLRAHTPRHPPRRPGYTIRERQAPRARLPLLRTAGAGRWITTPPSPREKRHGTGLVHQDLVFLVVHDPDRTIARQGDAHGLLHPVPGLGHRHLALLALGLRRRRLALLALGRRDVRLGAAPLVLRLPVRAEDLHAAVGRVAHEHGALVVHGDGGGVVELPVLAPLLPPLVQERPELVEDLDAVVLVRDEDAAVHVHGHRDRRVELPRPGALAAELAHASPGRGIEHAYAVVALVAHVELAVLVRGDAPREQEL